jgi:hypothetical protein
MRIFLASLTLFTAISAGALAAPVPASRAAFAPRYTGGSGQDMERVRVVAEEEQLRDGTYFFRFSMSRRSLLAYNLPHIEIMQACEFQRTSGGRIGDYKPKGIEAFISIGTGWNAGTLFQHGNRSEDYNEARVEKRYQFARGETRIVLNDSSRRAFELFCANKGPGRHQMQIRWWLAGRCRWKPENWHKPESFPFEYQPELDASIYRLITTTCEG